MKKIPVIIIIICLYMDGIAQSLADLQFTHITTKDGLSTQYIRDIYQDSRGLMWICTTAGLNRYDGNQFKVYKNMPGLSNSLPSDDIWKIVEDKKGNFWVGTQSGLCYFEPNENRFTNYFHDPANKNSLANVRAENMVLDDDGYLWIGSVNGLQRFDPLAKVFELIQFSTKEELEKNSNAQAIYDLYLDKKKQLWANAGGNLYLVNRRTLSIKKIVNKIETAQGVNGIYQDNDGQYWLSYWGRGFAKFDGVYPPEPKDFITTNAIYFCFAEWKDLHNNTWLVITKDDGISFYNKRTGELITLKHDNDKGESFGSHGSNSILTDRNNNVWIAARTELELLETSRQFFKYHWLGEKKDREDYYVFGTPEPVFKDGDFYWAGLWHGKGLIKLNTEWQIIKRFLFVPPDSHNDDDKTVYGIYKDVDQLLWLTTDRSMVRFNEGANRFTAFSPTDMHPDLFALRKILPLGKNKLLVRSLHLGIYVFNKIAGTFEKRLCTENTPGFPSNDVSDIAFDSKGRFWVATNNGICCIDTTTLEVIEKFNHVAGNSNSLVSNVCRTLYEDKSGNLWIGTQAGVSKLDIERKTFTSYTTADGLCSNAILKLTVDNNNNVWLKTENGLSIFQQASNTFRNFYKEDGLPQNSLDGSLDKDADGIIYLGDAGIILTVRPDDIPVNRNKPGVIITDVLLGNNHFPIKKNDRGEKILETNSANSFFTINFAVLNFNSPKLNKYYYKLQSVDKDWHQSDRGVVSYLGMPPGRFVLQVKGSNNSGMMNEEGDSIIIIINPEWYQALWFKLLLVAAVALAVFLFVRWRINAIRKESAFKQKIVETEMQALRAQMNPHFIFNSLNSIENFIMQNEKRLASDYLNKFARLIRMILDSSRNELVPISKDMEALQLYIDLEQLRFNNKFTYKTYVDPVLLNNDYRVPSLLIQPYVENAIVHGLAHSEENNLSLTVTATLEDDKIKYVVQDNGVGRTQARIYHQQNKPRHKSVGIKITEDRVNIFNNDVKNGSVCFTDLYDEHKNPVGTKVEINIKAI